MKSNELMIGDLIYVYGHNGIIFSEPHWYVRKVTADWLVDMDTREAYDKELEDRGYVVIPEQQLFIGDTRPIPLTEEILKANGFVLKENVFGLWWWREEWLFKCSANKVIYITDGNGHSKDILYVHELQHALRLFGLNELADNFKVN